MDEDELIPEGCSELSRITIVRYFDPEAETGEGSNWSVTYALGLLDAVAREIWDNEKDED